MGILRKFCEMLTSKNLMKEWPNENDSKYFNLSDKLIRLLQVFFDELLDGSNVEMLTNTIYVPI